MGRCKQINNFNLQYVSDVISLIIHSNSLEKLRDFVDAMLSTLMH